MSRTSSQNSAASEPGDVIRITDPYIAKLVADEQRRTGERSMARTAARLITERLAIREVKPEQEQVGSAA